MISLLFFSFVGLVLLVGFVIEMIIRKKKRNKLRNGISPVQREQRKNSTVPHGHSAFNERPMGNIKGGIVPADTKRQPNDFNNDNEQDTNHHRQGL
ncbi:MAG: hypothetical protein ACTHOF_10275 [Flavisolibacter sp.]